MLQRWTLIPSLALCAATSQAQSPTWHQDVSCIVFTHCTPCHHDGGAGHFSLMTYQEAYWWRNEMRAYTQARYMPPWPPDPSYRSLAHERVLSQAEIDLIAEWVDAGAPEGDPASALPLPQYTDAWAIADPDLTLVMPDFVIPSSTNDLYRCFVMPSGLLQDRFITAMEVVPGNRAMVHHVLVYQDLTGQAAQLDAQDPAPGYTSFGGIGVPNPKLLGGWVPGSTPFETPTGMGIRLQAGADVVIQVHYPATSSTGEVDSTRLNFRFSTQSGLRSLSVDPILYHFAPVLQNGPLVIPPHQVRTFHQRYTVPAPVTITSIAPHAHLVCTSMRSFAVLPSGDTLPLIDIPHWDFAWQDFYRFRRPIHLPAGTQLHGYATYDNTENNPNNPNTPPLTVTLGEATTDEMMLFYFSYTSGTYADTLIVVDDSDHAVHYMDCAPSFGTGLANDVHLPGIQAWPVPSREVLFVDGAPAGALLRLIDISGRSVLVRRASGGLEHIDIHGLTPGGYVLEISDTGIRSPRWRSKVMVE